MARFINIMCIKNVNNRLLHSNTIKTQSVDDVHVVKYEVDFFGNAVTTILTFDKNITKSIYDKNRRFT